MKPIETIYKGYRFRSRLEARWAVFFDSLGLEWEYEKEGFELDDGTKYLPDFYLPDWDLWIEIKPSFPDQEIDKISRFSEEVGAILLLYSLSEDERTIHNGLLFFHATDRSGGGRYELPVCFRVRRDSGKIILMNFTCRYDYVENCYTGPSMTRKMDYFTTRCLILEPGWMGAVPPDSAYLKAKQARFEYGQHPA